MARRLWCFVCLCLFDKVHYAVVQSRRKRLASGVDGHREPAVELSPPHEPSLMPPPVAECEPVPLQPMPDLPPVRDAMPLPGPPPVRDMLTAAEPFARFSPPPPFDEPFAPVYVAAF